MEIPPSINFCSVGLQRTTQVFRVSHRTPSCARRSLISYQAVVHIQTRSGAGESAVRALTTATCSARPPARLQPRCISLFMSFRSPN